MQTNTFWSQTFAVGPTPPLSELGGRASLENPRVSLNDPEAYDLLTEGGGTSDSGVRVTRQTALKLPAVWQAVATISGDIAKLPFDMFRKHADGDRELLEAHPTHRLVRRKPNREMNAFKFWQRMLIYRLLWNNAYAFIVRNGDGSPRELLPLLPDRTAPERKNGQLIYVTEVAGNLTPLFPEQVFHIEGLSLDNLQGEDILKSARDAWGLGLAQMKFASKFFKHGARAGGILELPSSMPKTAKDKVEEGFRRSYENNDEAFKTVVLRDNAKFHAAQVTPEQTQGVESRQESARDVARYFLLQPSRLGVENGVGYKSKSEDNRDYKDTTLSHHTAAIKAEADDKLLTPAEQAQGLYFEHDYAALLQLDFKSTCESLKTLVSAEVLSKNEARAVINYNRRRDPGGDEFRNPFTTSNTPGANPPPSDEEPAPDGEALARAHRQLLVGALNRVALSVARRARKPCASAKAFCAWLDDEFGGQREPLKRAVEPIVIAHAAATRIDAGFATTELVELVMTSLTNTLNAVAESTPAKDLHAQVERALVDFGQTRCLAIAEQIIK